MAQVKQRAAQLDILIERGDDFIFTIVSPIDLSGYTLSASSGNTTFAVSATPGMPSGFYYNVTITDTQSTALPAVAAWSLEWTDPSTLHRTIAKGRIAFSE